MEARDFFAEHNIIFPEDVSNENMKLLTDLGCIVIYSRYINNRFIFRLYNENEPISPKQKHRACTEEEIVLIKNVMDLNDIDISCMRTYLLYILDRASSVMNLINLN